ncbi:MAG TPA: glycosyltransferase family 4 protein [Acidimicrobiales bacterium]|nr:glycosyltransferase family 4 protein [Acidimicrobiales bacterium]
MRVAFVTPRYGRQVIGGAESAARQLAEHLVASTGWRAEVFTSTALDHITWRNELEPGDQTLDGVLVHRFASEGSRSKRFYDLDGRLRLAPAHATREQAEEWVDLNGPVTPRLVDALCASGADVAVFYPYLYYPTVRAIGRVPMPAVLHPAAHDEPALYLPVYADTFANADALVFQTMAERELVQDHYPVAGVPQILLGLGTEPPTPRRRRGADILGIGDRPYVVSVGRVDEHKGSKMLAAYFAQYKARRAGPLALALVGPVAYRPAPHPDVLLTGTVSDEDKFDVMRDALAFVSPSALEAFSLVVAEAWTLELPVVVNARCGATREHCERSGGGVWFGSYREFEAVLDRLAADAALRRELGARGRRYVDHHYRWPVLIDRYARFLGEVADRGKAAAPTAAA